MRKTIWLIIGILLGAGLLQGARLVKRQMMPRSTAMAGHSHAQGADWATMPDKDLEIARVFLIERRSGIRAAFDTLTALVNRDSSIANLGEVQLHQIAHSMGRYAATRGSDGVDSFKECMPGFLSGCPHGMIEGYFSSKPRVDSASLVRLCDRIAPKSPSQWVLECAHGVGHGLFQLSGGDVSSSLEKCRAFAGNALLRECTDGVFMSQVQSEIAEPTHAESAERCSRYGGVDAISCWYYEAAYLNLRYHNDFERAMRDCPRSPNDLASACFNGFGRQMVGMKPKDYAEVARVCRLAGDRAKDCIAGAVTVYTDETWSAQDAGKFCALWTGDLKIVCERSIANEMSAKSGD